MNVLKLMNDVNKEMIRLRSTTEPNAASRVKQGEAQYVTETPNSKGRFDCVEISEWMPVSEYVNYLKTIV